jgi:CRP-like cAMP-binding protein/di/tricarboxylate transporter
LAQPERGQLDGSQTPAQAFAELLAGVEIFSHLDRVTLARLAAHLEPMSFRQGEAVFSQGDEPGGLYVITRGRFGIYAESQGELGRTRLAILGPGECFGEMALLADEPRSATVVAEQRGEVLCLERSRFLRLLGQEPGVSRALGAILSRRLRAADRALQEAGQSVHAFRLADTSTDEPLDEAAAGVIAAEALEAPADASPAAARRWTGWRPGRSTLALALAGAALLGGWLAPPPPGLSVEGWHALATLGAVVPLLALEALPEGVIALALATVWVIGGIVEPRVALSGFASSTWVLVVSVLAVGAAIASTGLLYRLALWAVAHARAGFSGQVLALGLAGLLVGPSVPNATGRVTLIAPAATELVEALGYAPGSRAAAGLAMATLMGFGQMVAPFLTSSSTAVLVFAVLPESARVDLNWATWALRAAPTHVLLFLGLMAAVLWLYRPRPGETPLHSASREPYGLALQRALLGAPSPSELIALTAALALLAGFVAQPLHGLEPAWVGVLAMLALGAAGLLSLADLRAVNWSFALLFGILASMSEVFARVGLDRWVAGLATATVGSLADQPLLFVAVLTLACYAISLVLRWQAAAPLLTIGLSPLAMASGLNPWIVALVTIVACNGFFLPYQSTVYLALFHGTGGRLFAHAQARPAALAYGLVTLLALCASIPVWRWMGLM